MHGKYDTGGKVSGTGGQDWGGSAIDKASASSGSANNPNTKETAKPGGYGSKGTKSGSTPSKGM